MEKSKKGSPAKLIAIVAVFAVVIFALKYFGIFEMMTIDNLQKLKEWINGYGMIAPLIYIATYGLGALFFLPGTPLALLGGIAFGPVMGALWACTGATLGATLAFLASRYAARGLIEGWAAKNTAFKKIDDGVEKQGWRMVMITRLVPIFPYNVQNFAYGLTKVNILTYIAVSFICMLPGAAAFTFMSGAIIAGESIGQVLVYFGVGATFFALISFLPGFIQKKKGKASL